MREAAAPVHSQVSAARAAIGRGERRAIHAAGTVFALWLAIGHASAEDLSLPPRSQWRASGSSAVQPKMPPAYAIDGDNSTEWGGEFSPGNYLQVDLGRIAAIGGVLIHWDAAFATTYLILASQDGTHWQTAYQTADSRGGMDYVFFPEVRARYLRLASAPSTTDWGVAVFEFEPLAASESPQIRGLDLADPTALWSATASGRIAGRALVPGTRELYVKLPRPLPVAGLEVFWESARRGVRLEGRAASGKWQTLAEDPLPLGESSYLAAFQARPLSELRLRVRQAPGITVAVRRLRLLSPTEVMTTLKRYEIVAARAHRDLFPASLHDEQVYWTEVGVPAGLRKSLFDEYGDVEAFKGAPLVQPLWRDRAGSATAAFEASRTHTLRRGWMPLPAVQWSPAPGLRLTSEAIADQPASGAVTLVRHRLTNTGTTRLDGQFAVLVRPVQINPPWQHGGLSPINTIAIEGDAARTSIAVNDRTLLVSLTPVARGSAAAFGPHGETELTHYLAEGQHLPRARGARAADGLAAASLLYDVHLEPGASRDVVLSFPLADTPASASAATPAPSFDAIAARLEAEWQARLGRVGLTLPDASLVDMLRAQAAYMLINQTGPAIQPGPRNYSRSFLRDGSATAMVLLRLGLTGTARDYLSWYAAHAVHDNGLVSPILNADGSVNRGYGSDIEYDSQGEFVTLVAEVARLDGGPASVRQYEPQVRRALQFLEVLRERTLVPGYMGASESPERFRGLIAPSISHEGYSTPTHSYWDDYWALKGWHDGEWLAREWGDEEFARWAQQQYEALRASLAASIRLTMEWKGIDFVPASADLGDGDPSSVSIGIDPCGQADLLPLDALLRTFSRYLAEVRRRAAPDAVYAYTPYEFRNVLTFVHLDQPAEGAELLARLLAGRRPAGWQVLAEVVRSQVRNPYYLGDMPHTWVGAEYVRAVIGMLMHEDDDRLVLLPGVPGAWLADQGVKISALPTAFGALTLSARRQGAELSVVLEPGLRPETHVALAWPERRRPNAVSVDGQPHTDYDADGIRLAHPFREIIARW